MSFKEVKLRKDRVSHKHKLRLKEIKLVGGEKALTFEKFEENLHFGEKHKV